MTLLKNSFSWIQVLVKSNYSVKTTAFAGYAEHFAKMLPSKTPSKEEWDSIRRKLLNSKVVLLRNDSSIMHLCASTSGPITAQSYYTYLKENNYKIDPTVLGKYLEALSHLDPPLSQVQQKEITEAYEELQKQNYHKSTATILHSIKALCLTDNWMKSLELLKDIEGYGSMDLAYQSIILAAIRHDCMDIVFELLEKSYALGLTLLDSQLLHDKYIGYMEQKSVQEHRMYAEKMFHFWHKYNIIPCRSVLRSYLRSCKKYGWTVNKTSIENDQSCNICTGKLQKLSISSNDYKMLKHVIVDKLFLFSSCSTGTLSNELIAFRKFMSRVELYHVVIDGLNITHKHKRYRDSLGLLPIMVDSFKNKGYSVLVIGRKHLAEVPGFRYIAEKSSVFLVNNETPDDPFILYAALALGPDTKFLSSDLMRNYREQLPNVKLRRIFKLWQLSRQYVFNNDNRIAQHPVEFQTCGLHENGHWHIASSDAEIGSNAYDYVLKWHCAKPPLKAQ